MERNNGNYLALVSEQAVLDGILTEEDVRQIKSRLWHLLAERTQRYTMGDSTSVPVETAGELLRSVCFTIALHLKTAGANRALLLRDMPLPELLQAGRADIEAQVKAGRECLQKVKDSAPKLCNLSYWDTLAGLETFFKKYDIYFFAHEIPCDMDYQLCLAVPEELQGIEYINEYLRRLRVENEFCGQFETCAMTALLKSYCADYEGLLINLYEPVAVNALGIAMLEGDIPALNITDRDRMELMNRLKDGGKAKTAQELRRAAEVLCGRFSIGDAAAKDYLKRTAAELCPRILAALPNNRLERIFLTLMYEEAASTTVFVDGERTDGGFTAADRV